MIITYIYLHSRWFSFVLAWLNWPRKSAWKYLSRLPLIFGYIMLKQGLGYHYFWLVWPHKWRSGRQRNNPALCLLGCEAVANQLLVFLADNSRFWRQCGRNAQIIFLAAKWMVERFQRFFGSNSGLHINSVLEPSNDSETDLKATIWLIGPQPRSLNVHFTAWFLALIFV